MSTSITLVDLRSITLIGLRGGLRGDGRKTAVNPFTREPVARELVNTMVCVETATSAAMIPLYSFLDQNPFLDQAKNVKEFADRYKPLFVAGRSEELVSHEQAKKSRDYELAAVVRKEFLPKITNMAKQALQNSSPEQSAEQVEKFVDLLTASRFLDEASEESFRAELSRS